MVYLPFYSYTQDQDITDLLFNHDYLNPINSKKKVTVLVIWGKTMATSGIFP